jgi:hypothetical protein
MAFSHQWFCLFQLHLSHSSLKPYPLKAIKTKFYFQLAFPYRCSFNTVPTCLTYTWDPYLPGG